MIQKKNFKKIIYDSWPFFIFGLTFLSFLPSLQNGFVNIDDEMNFVQNLYYRGLGWEQLQWMWGGSHFGHYIPLSWMTLGFDFVLWGMNPFGYHLTNLIFHSLNAVLFFFLLRILLGKAFDIVGDEKSLAVVFSASVGAFFFSIHPMRVESVVWITERRDILSGFFYLLTLLCFLRYRVVQKINSTKWYALSLLFFLMALLSKAIVMTLPFALLFMEIYFFKNLSLNPFQWGTPRERRFLWDKIPFFLLAAIFGGLALLIVVKDGMTYSVEGYGWNSRLAQMSYGLFFYVRQTFFPHGLSPLYTLHMDLSLGRPLYLICFFLILGITGFLGWKYRKKPGGFLLWVFYVVTLFPFLGGVQIGEQIVTDRYSYLSCLGWAFFVSWVGYFLWQKNNILKKRALLFLFITPLCLLARATWVQSKVWKNSERLWTQAVEADSQNFAAWTNLGIALGEQNKVPAAIRCYEKSVQLNPRYGRAYVAWGNSLDRQGQYKEASLKLKQAVRLSPRDAGAYYSLAGVESRMGKFSEAITLYKKSLEYNPRRSQTWNNLGGLYWKVGQKKEALFSYKKALSLDPKNALSHYNLGLIFYEQGLFHQALDAFQKSVLINPTYDDAFVALGNVLWRLGKRPEAGLSYQKALSLNPQNLLARENLVKLEKM